VVPEPATPVIRVDGDSLPNVSFVKFVVDVPSQRSLGYHHDGMEYTREQEYRWDPHFADETDLLNERSREILAEAGYHLGTGGARLVGTIGPLAYNSYTRKTGTFDQADCTVRWDLYGPGADKPVFMASTRGGGRVADHKPGAIAQAYETALRNLLARPDFVAAVAAVSP
jgi:hypothetical protein